MPNAERIVKTAPPTTKEEEEEQFLDAGLFDEPEEYRKPEPEATFETFERLSENIREGEPSSLQVRLVGSHPLWGHLLWNAAKRFATRLDTEKELVRGKNVLELGAGAALPSFLAALNGANKVVVTDYPDPDLMGNIEFNANLTVPEKLKDGTVQIKGYIWGYDPVDLLDLLPPTSRAFNLIILSDLIFNHSQHEKLLITCRDTLSRSDPDAAVYVYFTHHRPHLAHMDMGFFDVAVLPHIGFVVERVEESKMPPMFEKDPGSAEVRGTIHGFKLTFPRSG